METVEVIIRIPKKDYENIECQMVDTNQEWRLKQAVREGTVLSKGHGKIVDLGKIDKDRIEKDNLIKGKTVVSCRDTSNSANSIL